MTCIIVHVNLNKFCNWGRANMNLSYISKYRIQIMGLAIISIVGCHNTFLLPSVLGNINNSLRQLLQIGVDFFLFLSGMGCYYSLYQNPNIKRFYKRRMLRIFPSYVISVLVFFLCYILVAHYDILQYLYDYSIVSFYYSGNLSLWFFSAIVVLYLFYPLLFKLIKQSSFLAVLSCGLLVILSLPIWSWVPSSVGNILSVFGIRIPIFIFGSYFSKRTIEKTVIIDKNVLVILMSCLMVLCLLSYLNIRFNKINAWYINRALFCPITLCALPIIADLLDTIKNSTFFKCLSFLGGITFEIYLTHERILYILQLISEHIGLYDSSFSHVMISIGINIIAMIVSTAMGYGINRLIHLVKTKIDKHSI